MNSQSEETDQVKEDEAKPQKKGFVSEFIDLVFSSKKFEEIRKSLPDLLEDECKRLKEQHGLQDYLVVFLWKDEESIEDNDVTSVYSALPQDGQNVSKPSVLLLIDSTGGKIEPAYLISKACKRLSGKFVVSVPRKAKSAATLISLGADEIHMGLSSELGPIDPQIGGIPAQALSNALRAMAGVVSDFPQSAEMFAKFLSDQLNLRHLGYFERLNESAIQYGTRLLGDKQFPDNKNAEQVARHLVNHYKDHSFVIDADEASSLLGENFIKQDTQEYRFSKSLLGVINFMNMCLEHQHSKKIAIVGAISDGGIRYIDKPVDA